MSHTYEEKNVTSGGVYHVITTHPSNIRMREIFKPMKETSQTGINGAIFNNDSGSDAYLDPYALLHYQYNEVGEGTYNQGSQQKTF
ncbi:hypothetical protein [Salibacterium qingdaonense]|uniref:Uncharacterized protein n=1 Tax=Salibacterium qingdaonense TaxID=266892 RepID=A0A1I4P527_9BACI|nr:hypothetical protein [Salibacterium qingdaonense]SFM22463.1 hypothetical protein SAMN04488054_1232 [Salibacterium qingdaonense]